MCTSAHILQNTLLAAVKFNQMEVSIKDLKNIEVELNKNGGFTVWVTILLAKSPSPLGLG